MVGVGAVGKSEVVKAGVAGAVRNSGATNVGAAKDDASNTGAEKDGAAAAGDGVGGALGAGTRKAGGAMGGGADSKPVGGAS